MVSCRDSELLLQDYLDGYLLASQREVLEGHIRVCASCRSLLGDLRRLNDDLLDLPPVADPGDLSGRILGSIPEAEVHHVPSPALFRQAGTLLAAVLVVTLGFFVGARYGMYSGNGVRDIEIAFFAPAAGSVSLVGDFNEWDPVRHRMERRDEQGVWRLKLKLPPGVYKYGFLIDGTDWSKDPRADRFLADGFGGENSILFVEG